MNQRYTSFAVAMMMDYHRFFSSSSNSSKASRDDDAHHQDKQTQSTTTTTDASVSQKEKKEKEKSLDPPTVTWVDRYVPTNWQPYARLARMDKPIGTWLLLWPCWWSTALATATSLAASTDISTTTSLLQQQDQLVVNGIQYLTLFSMGAFAMRGAGCTMNDYWDQDLDKQVARTRTRPLASNQIEPRQALTFFVGQTAVGACVLLALPWSCFAWGLAAMPLVILYPLAKRFTHYPQAVLGLAMNWGAFVGFAAVYGTSFKFMEHAPIILPLYLSGWAWTMVYDTLYAHQDKEDDAKLGVGSTALSFGNDDNTRLILHSLALLGCQGGWLTAGYMAGLANLPYILGVTTAYGHLVWQIQTAQLDNPHNLAKRFRSNQTVGAIVFGSIVAASVFQQHM